METRRKGRTIYHMEYEIKNELKCMNCGSYFDMIIQPDLHIKSTSLSWIDTLKEFFMVWFDTQPGERLYDEYSRCFYRRIICPFCKDYRSWCIKSSLREKKK